MTGWQRVALMALALIAAFIVLAYAITDTEPVPTLRTDGSVTPMTQGEPVVVELP